MTDSVQPVAGWYPDPENSAAERWWDGGTWSDHRRPSTVAAVPPVPPPPPAVPAPPAAPADANAFAAPGASLSGSAPTAPDAGAPGAPAPVASATVSPYSAPAGAVPFGASPYGAPGYATTYTPPAPSNTMAIVGLVLALGGLIINFGGLTSLAGGILSTVALSKASKMRAQGVAGDRWGMALAGTICGYLFFVLIVGFYIALFTFLANNPDLGSTGSSSFS